jgi:hypothetical protein
MIRGTKAPPDLGWGNLACKARVLGEILSYLNGMQLERVPFKAFDPFPVGVGGCVEDHQDLLKPAQSGIASVPMTI